MKKLIMALAAIATLGMPVAASAHDYNRWGWNGSRYDQRYDSRYNDRYSNRYNNRYQDRRYYNDNRRYDDRYNRYNQRCNNGGTGTVLGAVAGGLLGRTVDSHGDRTLGTVLGAGGGALAGRALTRNCR